MSAADNNSFLAHGSMVASSWAVLFPLGAILIRVIPSSKAWIIHAGVMLFTLSIFTSGLGVAVWRTFADGYTITDAAHKVLGITIFSLTWTQPITGFVHHYIFQKSARRTIASVLHVFLGRVLITAGMINGGIGILLGQGSTRAENIAYGTVVGILWVTYFSLSFYFEADRANKAPKNAPSVCGSMGESSPISFDKKNDARLEGFTSA